MQGLNLAPHWPQKVGQLRISRRTGRGKPLCKMVEDPAQCKELFILEMESTAQCGMDHVRQRIGSCTVENVQG